MSNYFSPSSFDKVCDRVHFSQVRVAVWTGHLVRSSILVYVVHAFVVICMSIDRRTVVNTLGVKGYWQCHLILPLCRQLNPVVATARGVPPCLCESILTDDLVQAALRLLAPAPPPPLPPQTYTYTCTRTRSLCGLFVCIYSVQ